MVPRIIVQRKRLMALRQNAAAHTQRTLAALLCRCNVTLGLRWRYLPV